MALSGTKYIKGFNGLRAVSILLVLITHLGFLDSLAQTYSLFAQRVEPLINGIAGVNIFFALSGFLITRILLLEKQKHDNISLGHFYIRRFLRLFPPLIIYTISIFILAKLHLIEKSSQIGVIFSILYIYNFIPNKFYTSELGHTWSLGVEEQFYLVWPFIVNYFRQFGTIIFSILIIILCLLANLYLYNLSISYHHKLYFLKDIFKLSRWFIPAVAPIIVGTIFSYGGIIYQNTFKKIFENNRYLIIISLLFYLSPLYLFSSVLIFSYIIQSAGISILLLWILYNQNSIVVNIFEFKPLEYVGKISYGIYIYHGLFIRTGPGGNLWIQKYPINVLLTFGVAIISFEFVEKKVLLYKSRFAKNIVANQT